MAWGRCGRLRPRVVPGVPSRPFPRADSLDRFPVFAGKPIDNTHDNGEKAKAEYNHHAAHDAFTSYLEQRK